MKLPILGDQVFMLRIVSRTKAKITLVGGMSLDEFAPYSIDEKPGGPVRLRLDFNKPTLQLLARYRTRIRETMSAVRALVLAGTAQSCRYCNCSFRLLAWQIWVYLCL